VDDKEPFLSRWSRRKLETQKDAPVEAPQAAGLPAAEPAAPRPPATEPHAPGAAAGVSPEYREFFDPQVEEKLRRTALKRLFGDPHFNVMDGLDTYIDDYSKPDPIPEAMLRQLNQAKDLFLFDDEKQVGDEKQASERGEGAAAAGGAAAASPVAGADTRTPPEPPPARASDEAAGGGTSDAAGAPAAGSRND
jgi:hypothetical protein